MAAGAAMSAGVCVALALSAALGINLGAPGAMASLQAALSAMASLSPPGLAGPPMTMASLIGILAALANIKSGLGVNLLAQGAAASLQTAINAFPLAAMANLSLAASDQAAAGTGAAAAA
jgi:hypothetical protein